MTNLIYFLAGLAMGVFFERSFRSWLNDQEQKRRDNVEYATRSDMAKLHEQVKQMRTDTPSLILHQRNPKPKPRDHAQELYWQGVPHVFLGRTDRDCETCGQPDRYTIHHIESYTS